MRRKRTIVAQVTAARLIEQAGAARVSAEAAEILSETLEQKGKEIGKRAQEIATHARRKTVVDGDVKLAAK